ncbi:hypothetical protein P691DRAFT_461590 [Macrolepiota fuliginosa MF-IS2]|uniref:Uncharacterized protein n=1 Tax=Macrolepiota fuliginosa MF-IS2 TaxID=1400762 RepID=A0A9P6C3B2_9AGAR|nr:hypothetical protein P691DRAFT_461590 [Macrolepiota fuliginosa MF-IS2]
MANILSSFPYTILAAFALAAPVGFALQPLPSEQNRRAPALTTMAAFSPLAITGYVLLAIMTSYALLRLYRFLKPRVLSSVTRATLPQPVSAGRTSSLSLYSPLSLLRARQKSTAKSAPTRSRWPPLTSLFRRLTRPSSPLHLSGAEVLPTTMPNSPSNSHSLMDLPIMSGPVAKKHSHKFKQSRQLSRSSSMDTLPSYRPLTPVPVLVPLPVYTIPPPPATPPPPSPTTLSGTTDSDIPLVPITPPKRKYTPAATASPSGMPTPPPTSVFPAISLSPFKPSNSATTAQSNNVLPARPSPPSPNLFLSSRTLSSLSLSPRSLYLQQHKRSKSLGGVAVKKIPTPPQFDLDGLEKEHTEDVADSTTEETGREIEQAHTLIVPASEKEKPALSSDLLSPSPVTSNSGSTPASAPLRTPRTISNSSYSSDIAKHSEHESLLPRPIPLVDVDMNADMDTMLGFGATEKDSGWGLDIEEPVVERVLVDFGVPVVSATGAGAYRKAEVVGLGIADEQQRVGEKLIDMMRKRRMLYFHLHHPLGRRHWRGSPVLKIRCGQRRRLIIPTRNSFRFPKLFPSFLHCWPNLRIIRLFRYVRKNLFCVRWTLSAIRAPFRRRRMEGRHPSHLDKYRHHLRRRLAKSELFPCPRLTRGRVNRVWSPCFHYGCRRDEGERGSVSVEARGRRGRGYHPTFGRTFGLLAREYVCGSGRVGR